MWIFQMEGLAKNIRLCHTYHHSNTKQYNPKGIECILCHHILKQKKQSTTIQGCMVHNVPLCSSSAQKLSPLEESCGWRWHNTINLTTLPPPKLVAKLSKISLVLSGANILPSLKRTGSGIENYERVRRQFNMVPILHFLQPKLVVKCFKMKCRPKRLR